MRFERDKFSIEAAQRKKRKLPDWFLDEPSIVPDDEFYFKAFWDLSTCRQIGMSLGPIPWDKTIEYGHIVGLDDDMIKLLVEVIRTMDVAYMKWEDAQHPTT